MTIEEHLAASEADSARQRTATRVGIEAGRATAWERLGVRAGAALAPVSAVVSAVRGARALHADGVVYRADVEPLAQPGATTAALRGLAARLTGVAIVRFSSALWDRSREWPDLLGCAVRFRGDAAVSEAPTDVDQDVLFATACSAAAVLLAPLRTNVHDYLGNEYGAVTPFDVQGVGRAHLRLTAPRVALLGRDRLARLEYAVAEGAGALRLELRSVHGGPGRDGWRPVAMIRLRARVELDQRALGFSPARTGRGIAPRGFVHALRAAAYRASQHGRPRR